MQIASDQPPQPQPAAKYGGYLSVRLPQDHWAWTPGYEGEYQADPRFVTVPSKVADRFDDFAEAVAAAQRVSAGARDAVAVVRDPGAGDDGPWRIDQLRVKPMSGETGYRGIDLEGVVKTYPGQLHAWQPLQSQRQVIVGAIVDGALLLDRVSRYTAADPDRDPDKPVA